jgi:hypothetical protein
MKIAAKCLAARNEFLSDAVHEEKFLSNAIHEEERLMSNAIHERLLSNAIHEE